MGVCHAAAHIHILFYVKYVLLIFMYINNCILLYPGNDFQINREILNCISLFPICQYAAILTAEKNDKKNRDIFLISAANINCGYWLDH